MWITEYVFYNSIDILLGVDDNGTVQLNGAGAVDGEEDFNDRQVKKYFIHILRNINHYL